MTGWMAHASSTIGGRVASLTRAPARAAMVAAVSTASRMAALASGHRYRTTPMRGADGARVSTRRSRAVMAAAANATSATPAPNTPTVSRCHEKHLTPTVGINLYDGL